MKNITVSVEDELYRRARVKAAEQETSVSALVKAFLLTVVEGETDFDRLAQEERDLRQRIKNFSAADGLPRAQLYDRR
jgi:plasmid stability protein